MQVILKNGLNFNELRQQLDHLALFKHTMCLEKIELASIVGDRAYYDIQYVVRDCHVGSVV